MFLNVCQICYPNMNKDFDLEKLFSGVFNRCFGGALWKLFGSFFKAFKALALNRNHWQYIS